MFVKRWGLSGVMLAGVLVSTVASSQMAPSGGGERGGASGPMRDEDAMPAPDPASGERPARPAVDPHEKSMGGGGVENGGMGNGGAQDRAQHPRPGDPSQPGALPGVGAGPAPGMGGDAGGPGGDGGSDSSAYTVRRGDTLASISQRLLGDGNRWKEIAQANDIRDPGKLAVGKRLTIPSRKGAAATGRGDSMGRESDSMNRDRRDPKGGMNPGDDEGRTRSEGQLQDEDPTQPGDATNPMDRESNDPMRRPGANPEAGSPSQAIP